MSTPTGKTIASPSGTRDFYPQDLRARRYIEHAWRQVSVRHGFEEIDGPTFELTDLYAVKSGEGILSELFQTFSGKDELQRKAAGEGRAPLALRPEFTPTLARMYAARAAQLPKPVKWFWQSTCFRAERPQRGRLREFMQWNCDIVGDASPGADVEAIGACVSLLEQLGVRPGDVRVRYSHRAALGALIAELGVDDAHQDAAFVLLDRRDRLDDADIEAMAFEFGVTSFPFLQFLRRPRGAGSGTIDGALAAVPLEVRAQATRILAPLAAVEAELRAAGLADWSEIDLNIARGLAYYTGMVFEVHEATGALRAIAGGGRYDRLIETFGGPPTPAVGFGMGDVVLSLFLQDKGLLPDDKAVSRALGLRPGAFVISNGTPEADGALTGALSRLRRAGVHARRSYKATKNVGKLLKDAADADARFALILENAIEATIKDMDAGTQERLALDAALQRVADAAGSPRA
jgi:histidyl-tRNA synthetase